LKTSGRLYRFQSLCEYQLPLSVQHTAAIASCGKIDTGNDEELPSQWITISKCFLIYIAYVAT
jgi:hypothetical protein